MSILRLFRDGSRLEFGKGHLDQWSVYMARPNAPKVPAPELECLTRLETLGVRARPQALYDDYIVVYNRTSYEVQPYLFDLIHGMARCYGDLNFEVEVALALAYAGLVAHERRHRSRPGVKRERRLGVHAVLAEGRSAAAAVALLKGKTPAQLAAECAARGF